MNHFPSQFVLRLATSIALAMIFAGLSACKSTKPNPKIITPQPAATGDSVAMFRSLHLQQDMIPPGKVGRWKLRPMRPTYITVHSTQNFDSAATARQHSIALKRGSLRGNNSLGFLTWHFTVDENQIVQHLPLNERGEHADFDGPGNRYSVGIEMCENRGSNRAVTVDRAARLTGTLMYAYGIPLRNVVPHYHWPRYKYKDPHKNCPHFLMDNGKPGRTWQTYLARVDHYYKIARTDINGFSSGNGGPNQRSLQAYFERGSMAKRGYLAGSPKPSQAN